MTRYSGHSVDVLDSTQPAEDTQRHGWDSQRHASTVRRATSRQSTPIVNDGPAVIQTPGRTGQRPLALLATGDLDSRQITKRLDPHYQIIATTNLPAAVAVLGDVLLDFVLVDAALPDPAMMELITHVRVRQWLRNLPIICYSEARPGTAVSRLAAHDVIIEPVSTNELITRISAALSAAR